MVSTAIWWANHTQLVGYFHIHIDTQVDIQVQPIYQSNIGWDLPLSHHGHDIFFHLVLIPQLIFPYSWMFKKWGYETPRFIWHDGPKMRRTIKLVCSWVNRRRNLGFGICLNGHGGMHKQPWYNYWNVGAFLVLFACSHICSSNVTSIEDQETREWNLWVGMGHWSWHNLYMKTL